MASIMDCKNELIKVGKTSITIKNRDTGKTKGIVRNVCKFRDLPINKQMEFGSILRKLGIWCSKFVSMDHVFINGKEIIVLKNLKQKEFQEKYGFITESEKESYEKREQFFNDIADKVTIIECYLG